MNETMKQLMESLTKFIRPQTYPVAVKMVKNGYFEMRPAHMKTPFERTGYTMTVCQVMGIVRHYGWSMALENQDYACPPSLVYMGYYPEDTILKGKNAMGGYALDQEAGRNMERANAALPLGMLKELWFSPVERNVFEPDVIVVYGNPAQIARLIHAANYASGKGLTCTAYARAACSSYIVRAFLEKECVIVVPSGGERIFGMAHDDEMIFAIPANRAEEVAMGLEATHKAGLVRYPTPFQGLLSQAVVPDKYWDVVPPERRPK